MNKLKRVLYYSIVAFCFLTVGGCNVKDGSTEDNTLEVISVEESSIIEETSEVYSEPMVESSEIMEEKKVEHWKEAAKGNSIVSDIQITEEYLTKDEDKNFPRIAYIQISGLKDKEVEYKVNEHLKNAVASWAVPEEAYWTDLEADVTYIDENYLSVRYYIHQQHGTMEIGVIVDLNNGDRLLLSDIVEDNDQLKEQIIEVFESTKDEYTVTPSEEAFTKMFKDTAETETSYHNRVGGGVSKLYQRFTVYLEGEYLVIPRYYSESKDIEMKLENLDLKIELTGDQSLFYFRESEEAPEATISIDPAIENPPTIVMEDDYFPEGVTEVTFENYSIREETFIYNDVSISYPVIEGDIENLEIENDFLRKQLFYKRESARYLEEELRELSPLTINNKYHITYADENIMSLVYLVDIQEGDKRRERKWEGIIMNMENTDYLSPLDLDSNFESLFDFENMDEIIVTDREDIEEWDDIVNDIESHIFASQFGCFISEDGIGLISENDVIGYKDSGFILCSFKADK